MPKLKISEEFARLAVGSRLIGRNRDIGVKLVETSGQTQEGKNQCRMTRRFYERTGVTKCEFN